MKVKPLATNRKTVSWKLRSGPSGLLFFDRITGLNILFDECCVLESNYSRAPRFVSIALTNQCDLSCTHCFAPKNHKVLDFNDVTRWLNELDNSGSLGIGFGGGEPTLYSEFASLCRYVACNTQLSVSFTTHGHHINEYFADELKGSVHFIRVSMDGVGETYETIRRRSFKDLLAHLKIIQTISSFGINIVINQHTLPDLGEVASIAADVGASELLLLPQMYTSRCKEIDSYTLQGLRKWASAYKGGLKLCINEGNAEGFTTCNPFEKECGILAYAHIDAAGVIKKSSYHTSGVAIGTGSVMSALKTLGDFAH